MKMSAYVNEEAWQGKRCDPAAFLGSMMGGMGAKALYLELPEPDPSTANHSWREKHEEGKKFEMLVGRPTNQIVIKQVGTGLMLCAVLPLPTEETEIYQSWVEKHAGQIITMEVWPTRDKYFLISQTLS